MVRQSSFSIQLNTIQPLDSIAYLLICMKYFHIPKQLRNIGTTPYIVVEPFVLWYLQIFSAAIMLDIDFNNFLTVSPCMCVLRKSFSFSVVVSPITFYTLLLFFTWLRFINLFVSIPLLVCKI